MGLHSFFHSVIPWLSGGVGHEVLKGIKSFQSTKYTIHGLFEKQYLSISPLTALAPVAQRVDGTLCSLNKYRLDKNF